MTPSVRRCDSQGCTKDAEVVWEALLDPRFSLIVDTRCFFALCAPHDRFYSDEMPNHRSLRRPNLKVGLSNAY